MPLGSNCGLGPRGDQICNPVKRFRSSYCSTIGTRRVYRRFFPGTLRKKRFQAISDLSRNGIWTVEGIVLLPVENLLVIGFVGPGRGTGSRLSTRISFVFQQGLARCRVTRF